MRAAGGGAIVNIASIAGLTDTTPRATAEQMGCSA